MVHGPSKQLHAIDSIRKMNVLRPMELLRFSRTVPVSRVSAVATNKRMQMALPNRNNFWMLLRIDPVLQTMLLQRPFQMSSESILQAMNRNARKPKKANKGARPCSRVSRRAKKRAPGNWRR
jgi:hypothetical protein